MKELMAAMQKRAKEKDGMLDEGQAKARMSVLSELQDVMRDIMSKDLPEKGSMLEAHIEAESPMDMKSALREVHGAIPAIAERMKNDAKGIEGERAQHNLEPDVNEEKDKDMMANIDKLESLEDEGDAEPMEDELEEEDLADKLKKAKPVKANLKKPLYE